MHVCSVAQVWSTFCDLLRYISSVPGIFQARILEWVAISSSRWFSYTGIHGASLIAQLVKNPPAMQETPVRKIPWRPDRLATPVFLGFPGGSAVKESAFNVRDLGSVPGLGRSPGEGKGYPLQYSGLENSVDCTVHGVTSHVSRVSCIAGRFFTSWAIWEAPAALQGGEIPVCFRLRLPGEGAALPRSVPLALGHAL